MPDPGDLIDGRYELLMRLGEGSFGEVWKARDIKFKSRLAALKLLKQEHSGSAEILERFDTEAEALARLQHENIVGISDRGGWAGGRFIAMEYVAGQSLRAWLKEHEAQGRVPELPLVGDVFDQVCTGVAAAHAVSIIHRDLKPENIILCQREDRILVKILDFGIARVDARSGQSRTGFGLGTIAYMAPEQAVGAQSQIAPATDVFALGVILAEMLSLCPYPSRELGVNEPWWALIMRDEGIARSRLASLCGHVPAAVRDVVITALRREPIKRYDVAGNMRRAFRASLSGAPPANAAATPATALHGGNMESRTMPLPAPPAQRAAVASDAPGGSVAGATVPTPAPASVLPQRRAMRVAGSVMGLGCMVVLAFAARRSFAPGRPSTESAEVLPAISLAPSSASSPVSLSATAAPSASSDTSSPAASAATAAPSASSDTPPPVAPRTNEGTAPAVAESTGESGQPQARATNPVTATNPVLPKGVAGEFDRAAASTTLDAAAATAKSCGRTDGPTGTGTISVTFDPSGRATSAQVQGPPFAGTAVGACINEVFHRTARAPPFRGSPVVVTRAFMVPWRPDSL